MERRDNDSDIPQAPFHMPESSVGRMSVICSIHIQKQSGLNLPLGTVVFSCVQDHTLSYHCQKISDMQTF